MSHPTDPSEGEHGASGSGQGSGTYGQYPSAGQYGGDQGGQYGGTEGGQHGGGYQQVGAGYQQAPKNGIGIAALILGILSIVTFWTFGVGGIVFGLIAIILGFIGRGRVKRGEANNGGVALAGIITGILGLLAGVVFIILVVVVFKSTGAGDLVSCVNDANGDQSKIQQCQNDFSSRLDIPTT